LTIKGIIWLDRLLYGGLNELTTSEPSGTCLDGAALSVRHREDVSYNPNQHIPAEEMVGPAAALLSSYPLCTLTRQPLPEEGNWAGTSLDTVDCLDFSRLSVSSHILMSLIDALEEAEEMQSPAVRRSA
jgi:hypothetical protein